MNTSDKNMLSGVHLATDIPIDIHLTHQEVVLATLKQGDINSAWESMCALGRRRTGIEIIGQISIDTITVNGIKRKFH